MPIRLDDFLAQGQRPAPMRLDEFLRGPETNLDEPPPMEGVGPGMNETDPLQANLDQMLGQHSAQMNAINARPAEFQQRVDQFTGAQNTMNATADQQAALQKQQYQGNYSKLDEYINQIPEFTETDPVSQATQRQWLKAHPFPGQELSGLGQHHQQELIARYQAKIQGKLPTIGTGEGIDVGRAEGRAGVVRSLAGAMDMAARGGNAVAGQPAYNKPKGEPWQYDPTSGDYGKLPGDEGYSVTPQSPKPRNPHDIVDQMRNWADKEQATQALPSETKTGEKLRAISGAVPALAPVLLSGPAAPLTAGVLGAGGHWEAAREALRQRGLDPDDHENRILLESVAVGALDAVAMKYGGGKGAAGAGKSALAFAGMGAGEKAISFVGHGEAQRPGDIAADAYLDAAKGVLFHYLSSPGEVAAAIKGGIGKVRGMLPKRPLKGEVVGEGHTYQEPIDIYEGQVVNQPQDAQWSPAERKQITNPQTLELPTEQRKLPYQEAARDATAEAVAKAAVSELDDLTKKSFGELRQMIVDRGQTPPRTLRRSDLLKMLESRDQPSPQPPEAPAQADQAPQDQPAAQLGADVAVAGRPHLESVPQPPVDQPADITQTDFKVDELSTVELRKFAKQNGISPLMSRQKILDEVRKIEEQQGKPFTQEEVFAPKQKRPLTRKGFINVGPVADLGKALGGAGLDLSKAAKSATIDWWSKPLIDRVESQGGPAAKPIVDEFRAADDAAKAIHGKFEKPLQEYLGKVSGRATLKVFASRKAVGELQQKSPGPTGSDFSYSKMQLAVEGKIPLNTLSKEAQDMVLSRRKLTEIIGQEAVRLGVKVVEPNGTVRPFVPAKDGMRWLRTRTPEAHQIMRLPDNHALKQAWAKAIADANGIAPNLAMMHINEGAEGPLFKRNAVETIRLLENYPAWIKHPKTGNWVEILNTDPFSSGNAMAQSAARRLGFIQAIGQDLPTDLVSADTAEELRAAGVSETDAKDTIRALNGLPIDVISIKHIEPGSYGAAAVKVLDATYSLFKSGALTLASIPNIFEPLTKTLSFAGLRPWAKAWVSLALHPKASAELTAAIGARTIDQLNWMTRPGHRMQDSARIIGQVLTYPLKMINEVNEMHAAVTGVKMKEMLQRGKGGGMQAEVLRVFGFSDHQIADLINGTASPAQYDAVATRFAERTQGTTSSPAQRSRAANNPVWRSLAAFDSYGQMTANRFAKVLGNWWDAVQSGKPWRIVHSTRLVGRMFFGHTLAGAATGFLLALAYGGKSGVIIKANEAKDDPGKFLLEAATTAMFGGVAASAYRATTDPRDSKVLGAMQGSFYPVSVLQEGIDFYQGWGKYKDKDAWEKAQTFFTTRFAVTPAVATVVAATGLSTENHDRDTAMRAYWRWRRQYPGLNQEIGGDTIFTDQAGKTRQQMRKLLDAINTGNDVEQQKALEAAIGTTDQQKVAASIRGKQLLSKLDDKAKAALQKHIGDKAYGEVERYDDLLESWASTVGIQSEHNKYTQQRHGQAMVDFKKLSQPVHEAERATQGLPTEQKMAKKATLIGEKQKMLVDEVEGRLSEIKQAIIDIEADKTLSSKEKAEQVNALDQAYSNLLRTANQAGKNPKEQK